MKKAIEYLEHRNANRLGLAKRCLNFSTPNHYYSAHGDGDFTVNLFTDGSGVYFQGKVYRLATDLEIKQAIGEEA